MTDYLNLKGFTDVYSTTLNNELQDNIIEFLDWGLLQKGNYQNVTLGETTPDGQDMSRLRLSSNESFAPGKAWESFRQNWVWQSGITYNPPPIVGNNNAVPGISGVYVNNIFIPCSTTCPYAHKVDYFNGRVIFNNPIPTGSIVQAEYSYKYINVIYSNAIPWLREVQYRSLDFPNSFNLSNKGDFEIPSEMRVQLPAIAVEIVPKRTMRGYQLGGGQFIDTDILFHCMAEDEFTRNKLLDIVSLQNDKTIVMFNSNTLAANNDFPLNYMGIPNSGALRYPDILSKYASKYIFLKNSTVQGMELINSNFYAGIVRMTAEIIEEKI